MQEHRTIFFYASIYLQAQLMFLEAHGNLKLKF